MPTLKWDYNNKTCKKRIDIWELIKKKNVNAALGETTIHVGNKRISSCDVTPLNY